jgi:hypothetical protein
MKKQRITSGRRKLAGVDVIKDNEVKVKEIEISLTLG